MSEKPSATTRVVPTARQLSWLLLFRIVVISLFLGGAIFFRMKSTSAPQAVIAGLILLAGLSYLQALGSAVSLSYFRPSRLMVQVQICWDLLFCTAIVYLTGGSDSIFSFLFILTIIYSAFLCSRRQLLIIASAAAILYGSLLDLQYYQLLPRVPGLPLAVGLSASKVLYQVFVNVSAFFLTGLLSGALAQRLRVSEAALRSREVDVQELARLNQMILENIGSGLMMIDNQGLIQTFNAAASALTGYSHEDLVGRHFSGLFPQLVINFTTQKPLRRQEMSFADKAGVQKIIGYGYSFVTDGGQGRESVLLTFQDLTEFKNLEQRYERAQRLAVVGRLASGMAHEIRNPLASISGSVQLLTHTPSLSADDLKLMNIVVREADRLSRLLGEFLDYAKPPKPRIQSVEVGRFMDDILDLLNSDPRCSQVEIHRDYDAGQVISFDPDQIRQSLWNLSINAIESMEGRGDLHIGVSAADKSIYIEDSGSGISPEMKGRIFDPFFTTKDHGTGLGLAMVYASMEAHGGEVTLLDGAMGGARFVLRF